MNFHSFISIILLLDSPTPTPSLSLFRSLYPSCPLLWLGPSAAPPALSPLCSLAASIAGEEREEGWACDGNRGRRPKGVQQRGKRGQCHGGRGERGDECEIEKGIVSGIMLENGKGFRYDILGHKNNETF